MFIGIVYVLGACFIWGMIFVIPQFMEGFSSIEVAVGRYLFYGASSSLILLKKFTKGTGKFSSFVWKKAFFYSFLFCIGYYPCLVLGLRYATPAICALILGLGPIVIALYGNWKEKECSYRSLMVPFFFILLGLALINVPVIQANGVPATYLWGLSSCFCALFTWGWYAVANARFLKTNRQVSSGDWATLNGVATFLWALLFVFGTLFFYKDLSIARYTTLNPQLISFLGGSAVLGVFCSWVGAFLWNRAILYLPFSFAGQLTIFETIFALLFIYILEQRLPPPLEFVGIVFFLIAILFGIKKFSHHFSS